MALSKPLLMLVEKVVYNFKRVVFMADYENDSKDGIVESLVNVNRVLKLLRVVEDLHFLLVWLLEIKKVWLGMAMEKRKK